MHQLKVHPYDPYLRVPVYNVCMDAHWHTTAALASRLGHLEEPSLGSLPKQCQVKALTYRGMATRARSKTSTSTLSRRDGPSKGAARRRTYIRVTVPAISDPKLILRNHTQTFGPY
ncbi:unnamed protein product [Periconia digitata]|uniref:Uncharacterized protein n=1 Tax=Periconia digitata TaxID=1303443 RepID=A0A9W4UTM8_9PLEO|nr:unnamed protein product [Periconia digitata]